MISPFLMRSVQSPWPLAILILQAQPHLTPGQTFRLLVAALLLGLAVVLLWARRDRF